MVIISGVPIFRIFTVIFVLLVLAQWLPFCGSGGVAFRMPVALGLFGDGLFCVAYSNGHYTLNCIST